MNVQVKMFSKVLVTFGDVLEGILCLMVACAGFVPGIVL